MRIDVPVSASTACELMKARASLGPTVSPLLVVFDHGSNVYTNPESGAPRTAEEVANAAANGLLLVLAAS